MTRARAGAIALRLATIAATCSAVGCPDDHRGEAAEVLRAIDAARDASGVARRGPVDALAHVPCSAPDVCRARDACADAFAHFAAGAEAEARVRASMRALAADGGALPAERLSALDAELDAAQREVDAARAGLDACERESRALRRAHAL